MIDDWKPRIPQSSIGNRQSAMDLESRCARVSSREAGGLSRGGPSRSRDNRHPEVFSRPRGLFRRSASAALRLPGRLDLGSGPGAAAAVLATLGFNFFFIPPVHTFTVEDPRNAVALVVFLLSGLLIG